MWFVSKVFLGNSTLLVHLHQQSMLIFATIALGHSKSALEPFQRLRGVLTVHSFAWLIHFRSILGMPIWTLQSTSSGRGIAWYWAVPSFRFVYITLFVGIVGGKKRIVAEREREWGKLIGLRESEEWFSIFYLHCSHYLYLLKCFCISMTSLYFLVKYCMM